MTSPIVSLPVLQDVIRRAVDRWPESRGRIERAGALIVLGAVDLLAVAEERQRRLVTADRKQAARARCSADTVALAYARSVGWAA